jgi:predicted membrane metal-binding protein
MRDRPALVYGAVGFVYLLVLIWAPTPAFRHLLPILLIAGLVVLGVEVLRRQSVREFPDARSGDAWHALRA